MKFRIIFALVFFVMLSSLLVSADSGMNVNVNANVNVNTSAVATSAQVNGSAGANENNTNNAAATSVHVNGSAGAKENDNGDRGHKPSVRPGLISAKIGGNAPNNRSTRAQTEIEIARCVAGLKMKFKNALPAVELRYICESKLGVQHTHGMYVARNAHSSVWDCVANLTLHTNKTLPEIRKECFSQFITRIDHSEKLNSSVEEDLNVTLKDPMFRHQLVSHMIKNRNAVRHISNNSHIAHELVNISGANKAELKTEVRFFMREKTLRRAFLERLRNDHRLMQNKTIIASFMPDNFNMDKTKIENITLPNNDTVVVRVNVHAKILGILPALYSEEVVNSNGTVRVKRPFWAFLAR